MAPIAQLKVRRAPREVCFDRRQSDAQVVRGGRIRFTPATSVLAGSLADLERDGALVGLLETEGSVGDALPSGAYRVYVSGNWRSGWIAQAVDGEGRVRAETSRVDLLVHGGRRRRAVVEESGITHACVMLPGELAEQGLAVVIRVAW